MTKKLLLPLLVVMLFAGCPVQQSETCAQFLDCKAHYDSIDPLGSGESTAYNADGSCWQGTQEQADACTAACEGGLEWLGDELESRGEDIGPCE